MYDEAVLLIALPPPVTARDFVRSLAAVPSWAAYARSRAIATKKVADIVRSPVPRTTFPRRPARWR